MKYMFGRSVMNIPRHVFCNNKPLFVITESNITTFNAFTQSNRTHIHTNVHMPSKM